MTAGVRRYLFRRVYVPVNLWLYERTGGRVGGRHGGAPVLLLRTTGRKTGKRRTTPLLYLADEGKLVVVASNGGSPTHPDWLLNLRSDPDVEVQVGREQRRVRARVTEGEERAALWAKAVAMYAPYDEYRRETDREIPVVALSPRPAA